tara:strand:+ start:98 stop:346 length:249 start_codon:yes stop_codon:yes gene_type:complete
MNIQDKMQEIHHKFGVTEKANYEIQLFVDDLIKKDRAEQLILTDVSHLLIAWEQYKKANWFESDSINVEGYLMEQFKAIYCG